MRIAILAILAGCGGASHDRLPPKRPNNELLIGTFERHPPDGTTAFRFRADGSITVAHDKAELDTKNLATGKWTLDKDQLTLTYDSGMCPGGGAGTYQVVLSKLGMHLKKVDDGCEQRSKLDGETLRRAP